MRFVVIDGIRVTVERCADCPLEDWIGPTCRHPLRQGMDTTVAHIMDRVSTSCPLGRAGE